MILKIEDFKIQVFTVVSIFLIYTVIFWSMTEFDNKVPFRGDEMYFQSIAVNFARGHGFPKVGGIEKFDVYKFTFENVSKPYPSVLVFENSSGPY